MESREREKKARQTGKNGLRAFCLTDSGARRPLDVGVSPYGYSLQ